jgi:hypothetical protein
MTLAPGPHGRPAPDPMSSATRLLGSLRISSPSSGNAKILPESPEPDRFTELGARGYAGDLEFRLLDARPGSRASVGAWISSEDTGEASADRELQSKSLNCMSRASK